MGKSTIKFARDGTCVRTAFNGTFEIQNEDPVVVHLTARQQVLVFNFGKGEHTGYGTVLKQKITGKRTYHRQQGEAPQTRVNPLPAMGFLHSLFGIYEPPPPIDLDSIDDPVFGPLNWDRQYRLWNGSFAFPLGGQFELSVAAPSDTDPMPSEAQRQRFVAVWDRAVE